MTFDASPAPLPPSSNRDFQVCVVGGGPTGLLIAAELASAGVRVVVLERKERPDTTIKAGSINVATAEILDRRGLRPAAEAAQREFFAELKAFAVANGTAVPPVGRRGDGGGRSPFPSTGHFAGLFFRPELVDQQDAEIAAHGGAGGSTLVRQSEVEALLARHALLVGVEIRRGIEVAGVTSLSDDDEIETGVSVETSEGALHVDWVVGADGGRSAIRRTAGIDFVGTDPEITGYQAIADLEGTEALGRGWNHTPTGVYSFGPVPGRILTVQFTGAPDRASRDQPVSSEELQASIRLVTGHDVTVRAIHGAATRWTDNARQAARYRIGRVLLAGDAAHVHSPFSGQGLNLGAGDAINLGWKLAATVNGWAPEHLIDTYETERLPIGAQVLEWTRAQVALMRGDEKTTQLRRIVENDLLSTVATTTHMVLQTSGVAQRYDLSPREEVEHEQTSALVGRLVGDMPLHDGTRLAEHFRDGGFVLVDRRGGPFASVAGRWAGRVVTVSDSSAATGCPELYRNLTGLLVRPDGIIAWATESVDGAGAAAGLEAALRRWAGRPTSESDTLSRVRPARSASAAAAATPA